MMMHVDVGWMDDDGWMSMHHGWMSLKACTWVQMYDIWMHHCWMHDRLRLHDGQCMTNCGCMMVNA